MQVKALLVLAISLLLSPAQWSSHAPLPQNLVTYSLVVLGELFVGGLLGLGLQFFFSGVQLGGLLISQTSGLTLADVFNPELNNDVPLFSQLMYLLALAIFLTLGGHRLLVAGLLSTYQALPAGGLVGVPSVWELLTSVAAQSFALGMRVAAPCITALLLTTVVLALVSRTLPQLNVLSFGFAQTPWSPCRCFRSRCRHFCGSCRTSSDPGCEACSPALKPRFKFPDARVG